MTLAPTRLLRLRPPEPEFKWEVFAYEDGEPSAYSCNLVIVHRRFLTWTIAIPGTDASSDFVIEGLASFEDARRLVESAWQTKRKNPEQPLEYLRETLSDLTRSP